MKCPKTLSGKHVWAVVGNTCVCKKCGPMKDLHFTRCVKNSLICNACNMLDDVAKSNGDKIDK